MRDLQMKMHSDSKNLEKLEEEVDKYLDSIRDLENVEGFICCVVVNDKLSSLIAANPGQMLEFAEELTNLAMTIMIGSKGETLQ